MTRQLQLFDDVYETSPPHAKGFKQRLHRFFYGDDIFISYSRSDSGKYAMALAVAMSEQGYLCFLDQLGTDVNRNMPESLKEKVRNSTALVLIGTEGAAASRYVREEVEIFKESKRPIHPISIDDALTKDGWPELAGLTWISESRKSVESGEPALETITQLKNASRYRRRNQVLRLSLIAGFAFIALTVIASLVVSSVQVAKAAQAEAKRIKAEAAATTAQGVAAQAKGETAQAVKDKGIAEGAAKTANANAATAQGEARDSLTQKSLAEAGTRRAQGLEREAKERAAATARQEAGQRATVLANTPGREFDALEIVVKAANAEFKQPKPASQVVSGLVAAVSAAGDGIRLQKTDGEVTYAAISPDAEKVFVETFNRATNKVKWGLWNARTGEPLTKEPIFVKERESTFLPTQGFRAPSPFVSSASFSRDGNRLAVAGGSDAPGIQIWDLKDPITNLVIDFADIRPYRMALDNNGSRLAIAPGDNSGFVTVKHLDKKPAEEVTNPLEALISLAYRKNNTLQIIGETGVFDSATQQVSSVRKSSGRFMGLSSDDSYIYSFRPESRSTDDWMFQSDFQLIYLRDDSTPSFKTLFSGYPGAIASATVLDGHPYVVTLNGAQARIYGVRTDAESITLRSRDKIAYSAISPKGFLAATANATEVTIWNLKTGQPLKKLKLADFAGSIAAMAFSDDGKRLALLDGSRMVAEVWDVATGTNLTAALGKCQPVNEEGGGDYVGFLNQPRSISFLHGNEQYVTMHRGGVVAIWNLSKCEPTTIKLEENVTLVALSADGTSALTVSKDANRSAKIWDLSGIARADGERSKLPSRVLGQIPSGRVRAAWVDHTQARLLLSNDDWNLDIWEAGLTTPRRLNGTDGEVYSAIFSEDGSSLSIVTKDGYVSGSTGVWDVNSGEKRVTIPGKFLIMDNRDPVKLSRDGSYLLAVHTDNTARIYPTTKEGFLTLATRMLAGGCQ
jgi:WD40 repeat protein